MADDPKTGYAPVNGLKMYYEIYGTGRPLVLLHGGLMTADLTFGHLIPALSKEMQVIAFELQGHGHTADVDRPFSHEGFADDVAAAVKYLKLDKVDLLGYSTGGEIAMLVAIRYPEVVNKLIIISAATKDTGWTKATRDIFPTMNAAMFTSTPVRSVYEKVAPDPGHFTEFVNKMRDFILKPFDFGRDNIKAIKSPTLLIFGDSDAVRPEHMVELFGWLGGWVDSDLNGPVQSQLAIYPGTSHTGLMMQNELLLRTILPFLST